MPSLALAALSASGRFVFEAAFVAGALLIGMTLLLPDPTSPLARGPLTALAVAGGLAVAWLQQRDD